MEPRKVKALAEIGEIVRNYKAFEGEVCIQLLFEAAENGYTLSSWFSTSEGAKAKCIAEKKMASYTMAMGKRMGEQINILLS